MIISLRNTGSKPFTWTHEKGTCQGQLQQTENRVKPLRILVGQLASCDHIEVTALDDNIDEPDEVYDNYSQRYLDVVNWTGPAPRFPRVVILDNDDPPPVRLGLSATEISENGGVATVTATLEWPSAEPTTVDLALTSAGGAVPARLTRTRLTIPARTLQSTGTAHIVALNNGVDAPDVTVTVTGTVRNSLGFVAPGAVELTVLDDDAAPAVRLRLSPAAIGEDGGVSTVTAALDRPSSESVSVTVAATAVQPATGTDFTLSANRVLSIAAGHTASTGVVTITAQDDSDAGHKQVQVAATVTGGTGVAAPAPRTLTIRDDESAPVLALALSDTAISENGGSTRVTAALDYAVPADTTVSVTAAPVQPATGADFTLSANTVLSIAAGQTGSTGVVTITARNDNLATPHKQVQVGATVTGGGGVAAPARHTLVIEDDDPAPVLAVVLNPDAITEGGASEVTATLNPAPGVQRTVTISAAPQAPAATGDFTLSGTTLTFASGSAASSGALTITARDNSVYAPDKRITVTAAPDGFRAAAPAAGTLTIRENDPELTVSLSLSETAIAEPNGATLVTARLLSAVDKDVTITVTAASLAPATTSYFRQEGATLTIAGNETVSTGNVRIAVVDNNVDEPVRQVLVTGAVSGAALAPPAARILTVDDDDATPVVQLALSYDTIAERGGTVALTARLNRPSSERTTVTVSATPGAGAAAGDFSLSEQRVLTIPAGATSSDGGLTVTAADDNVDQPNKMVRITGVAHNGHGFIAPGAVQFTIVDDEPTPIVALRLEPDNISEQGGTTAVTAQLDHPSSDQLVVTVAAQATDRNVPAGFTVSAHPVLTIDARATTHTGTVTITAVASNRYTGDRKVRVTGTPGTPDTPGMEIAPAEPLTLTIRDVQAAPAVTLALSHDAIDEAEEGSTTVTASVNGAAPGGRVTLVVTATPDPPATAADFRQTGSVLTIPAGGMGSTGVVTIAAVDDELRDPAETVLVTASVAGLPGLTAPAARTLTIADDEADPTLMLELSRTIVGENAGSSIVTAALNTALDEDVELAVAATPGTASTTDFSLSPNRALTIRAGGKSSSGLVVITAVDDDADEPPETLQVGATVTAGSGVPAPAARTLTIVDGEATPGLTLRLDPAAIDEHGGTSTVTARLAHRSGEQTTLKITATAIDPATGGDFTLSADPMLTIAAGANDSTGVVTITAIDDATEGQRKLVRVEGQMVSGGNGVAAPDARLLTINDDDGLPTVRLALTPATISENGGVSTVTASLSGVTNQATTVLITLKPVDPAQPTDITLSSNALLTIAAGATESTGTVTITGVDNTDDGPAMQVLVEARVTGGNGVAEPAPVTLTVADDEPSPGVTLHLAANPIGENGGSTEVTASLAYATSAETVLAVVADPRQQPDGSYFTQTGSTLTIAAAALTSTGEVTITAHNDDLDGPNKTVRVRATASGGNGVADPAHVDLVIEDGDALPELTLELEPTEIAENGGRATLTARLNRGSSEATTVTVSVTPVPPAAAGDVDLGANAVLVIAARATVSTGTVTITAVPNDIDAPDKAFTVGAAVTGSSGIEEPRTLTLTVKDDDAAPTVTLRLDPDAINEHGGVSAVTAALDHGSSAATTVTVAAAALDTPGATYFAQTGTTLTIAALHTASTGTVTIAARNDGIYGPASRRVRVSGDAVNERAVNGPAAVDLTINDDESLNRVAQMVLQLNPGRISENGGVSTVTAALALPQRVATVLAVQASAQDPATGEYFDQIGTTLTIAAQQTASTGVVTIVGVDDGTAGSDKTVQVAATVTGGYRLSQPAAKELTIFDDEGPPGVTLIIAPALIGENVAAATVTARLGHPASEDAIVTVAAAPVAPAQARDFSLSANVGLTITAGQTDSTGTVTITSVNNDVHAANKEVEVTATVTGGSGATAPAAEQLAIIDDEAMPAVMLALGAAAIGEAGGSTGVTATLSGASSHDTTITVTASAQSPASGAHFQQTGTELVIAAGQTTSTGTVTIAAVDDRTHGPLGKRVRVAGEAANEHGVTGPQGRILAITEDESLPAAQLLLVPAAVGENGGESRVTARLGHPSSAPATFWVRAAAHDPGSGDYFTQAGHRLTIAAGHTGSTGAVTVRAVNDPVDSADKVVRVTAGAATSTGLVLPAARDLTITDDDATPVLTLVLGPAVIGENDGTSRVTARLGHPSSEDTTVTVAAAAQAAATASDFMLSVNRLLTIEAGETASTGTVTIMAQDDALDGPNKMVRVTGAVAGGRGVAAPAPRTLTITDDDGAPAVSLVLNPAGIAENEGVSTIGARLSAPAAVDTTLNVEVTADAPAAASDFMLSANRMLTITAGATDSTGIVTVTAVDNLVHAPGKTLQVAATVAGVHGIAAPAAQTLAIDDDEAVPWVTLLLAPGRIAEDGGRSTVTAELSGASSEATTVRVRAAQVGPAAAEYFTLSTNPVLRIAAGATASTGTVTITALDDPVDRPNRQVRVTGEAVNRHGVTAPQAELLTIADDEQVPALALVVSPGAIAENGGEATVAARLGHPAGVDTTVTVRVTPVPPAVAGDFELSSTRVLTIAAGATGSTGMLRIRAADNRVDAPDKNLQVGAAVAGGNGAVAPPEQPLIIEDDEDAPRLTLALEPPRIGEKNGASTVTATLQHPSIAATTVTVAAAPYDPPAGTYFTQTGATLTIAAGAVRSTGAVTIAGVDDLTAAPDKRVRVTATAANEQGVVDPAERHLTITNEEVPPALTLHLTPAEISENAEVSTVTASLAYASGTDTTLTVTAGAHHPADGAYFTQAGAALTIAAGQTASTGAVTVTAVDDDVYGGDKTVRVAASVTGGDGVVSPAPRPLTITDDEAAPTVNLALSAPSVAENAGPVTVTAALSGRTATATTLTVTASNADPPAGAYHTQAGTALTIAAGQTASTGTVTIAPVDDTLYAPDRTVQVAATVAGKGLAAPAANTLTITEDETVPVAKLVLSSPVVIEIDEPVAVTAALSGATSEETTLTVTATPHEPAAGAYFAQAGSALTIAAGDTVSSGVVTVAPVDDGSANPARTVQVGAAASGGNGVAAPAAVQIEILDDEGAPTASIDVSPDVITENGGASAVTVRLSHPSNEQTELTVVASTEAARDTDYTLSGDLAFTIAATETSSATLTITWNDNDVDEPNRTVTFAAEVGRGDARPPDNRDLSVRDDDATPRVVLALSPDSIAENGGSAAVTAALERASSEQTTVTVTAIPVLPAAAADFELSANPVLTIAAGATASTGTLTIMAVDNSMVSPEKTVTVGGRASNPQGVRHPVDVLLTITDDDTAPVFEPDAVTLTVVENTAADQALGAPLTASDADAQTVSYHLGEEDDAAAFHIVEQTGQLRTLGRLDYEGRATYRFTVEARDPDGNAGRLAVTVNVTDVDEPPAKPSPPTVTPAGLTSVYATWTPPINTGPEIDDYDYRYRIGDPAEAWEEVTGTQSIALEVTIAGLVVNTAYEIQVRATNDEGTGDWSDSGTGRTDGNAWPMFDAGSGEFEVSENQTAVGSVTATDPDQEDSVTGYALTTAGDALLFDFDPVAGTLAFKSAPDFEQALDAASADPSSAAGDNVYVLIVTATSGTGDRERTTERAVAVTVLDEEEPPGAPAAEVAPMSETSLQVHWTPPPNTGPPVADYDYRYRRVTAPPVAAAVAGRSTRRAGAVESVAEPAQDWTEVTDTEITELRVMIEDLSVGTWYVVQVRAGNEEGYGPWSQAESARTDAPPATPPATGGPPPEPANSPPVFTPESSRFRCWRTRPRSAGWWQPMRTPRTA